MISRTETDETMPRTGSMIAKPGAAGRHLAITRNTMKQLLFTFASVAALALGHATAAEPPAPRGASVAKPATVVAFGDSITRGYGVPVGSGWVERLSGLLEKKHGKNAFAVFNAGGDGNTSAEGLERIQADVLAHPPGLVLVEFGGNDSKLGPRNVSVDDFERNLLTITERIRQQGGEVAFLTFPPIINEWHRLGRDPGYDKWGGMDQCIEQYRQRTRAVAGRLGSRLFDLDQFLRKFIAENGRERCLLKDGVHLTADANTAVADAMLKFIGEPAGQNVRK